MLEFSQYILSVHLLDFEHYTITPFPIPYMAAQQKEKKNDGPMKHAHPLYKEENFSVYKVQMLCAKRTSLFQF